MAMSLITDTASLAAFCQRLSGTPYVTVDTEFMRDRTYWPKLCLVQVGGPDEAHCIDPLAPDMDLAPLFALMADRSVLKVFHAARQDIEIFVHLSDAVPAPLFDTQVAAMVCGFGDSVGYDTLVSKLAHARIDKSLRFTDWSHRPLTERQISYALSDVTHLRTVYEKLAALLRKNGRAAWLEEEMAVLTEPETYRADPWDAWRRLKPRSRAPRFLNVLREVTAWREIEARTKNLPRQRVVKDEALTEIAAHCPTTVEELGRIRMLSKGNAEGRYGQELLDAVARGLARPESDAPHLPERKDIPPGLGPMVDLLKVLLKMKCDEHGVAQKLVAGAADLEAVAADDDADVPALHGWRREIFGADALRLKHGRIGLAVSMDGARIETIDIEELEETA